MKLVKEEGLAAVCSQSAVSEFPQWESSGWAAAAQVSDES